MTKTPSKIGAFAITIGHASSVLAQERGEWTAFEETGPVECYAVATPVSQENTRDGQPVEVARSETLLFVFYRPSENVSGQVAFTGGYPFAPNSPVTIEVGGTQFVLFTDSEWAWPANPEEDARLLEALRGGSEVVLTGQSGRGTVTRDTFSLTGFTPALDEAQRLCAS